jgi:hypothetical protein
MAGSRKANVQSTSARVVQLDVDEDKGKQMARIFYNNRPWSDCQAPDPATSSSTQVFVSTFKVWVGEKFGGAEHLGSHYMPNHLRRQLVGMRFQVVGKVCNREGLCKIDLMHFVLHFEHYVPIRAKHTNMSSQSHAAAGSNEIEVLRMVRLNHELLWQCVFRRYFFIGKHLGSPRQNREQYRASIMGKRMKGAIWMEENISQHQAMMRGTTRLSSGD